MVASLPGRDALLGHAVTASLLHWSRVTTAVPVVFLVLPVTVLFALYPGLISIVSLAR